MDILYLKSGRVGDCAYFAAPDEMQQAYLGRITGLYQTCEKGEY